VLQYNGVPAVVSTHEPFYCWNGASQATNHRWLANLEVLKYENGDVAEYHPCSHTAFRNVPSAVSSYDRFNGISADVPYYTEGSNIDSLILATAFPHIEGLPYAPQGIDSTTLPLDLEPNGAALSILDLHDQQYFDHRKIASSGLRLFSKKLVKLAELSLVNFLLELKDLHRVVRRIEELSAFQDWNRLCQLGNLRQYVTRGTLSVDYLNLQFGLCPFTRDVVSIAKALANWRKKLKLLLKRVHKIETIHATIHQYAAEGSDLPVGQFVYSPVTNCDGTPAYDSPAGRLELYRNNRSTPRVCMKYSILCEDMSEMNVELRGFLSVLGLEWDPVIVWNAIPFSFLLDWIWDISEWLTRWAAKAAALPVKLRVHDFCITWKYNGSLTLSTDHLNRFDPQGEMTSHTRRFDIPVSRFRRVQYQPDFEDLRLAGWDKNVIEKTSLAGALLTTERLQHIPLRRKRRFGPSNLPLTKIAQALGWKNLRQYGVTG
jgi:hypothetical protein